MRTKKLMQAMVMAMALTIGASGVAFAAPPGLTAAQAFLGVMSLGEFDGWKEKAEGELNARRFEEGYSRSELKGEMKLLKAVVAEAEAIAKEKKELAQSGKMQRKDIKLYRNIEKQTGTTIANHVRRERSLLGLIGNMNTKPEVRKKAYEKLNSMREGTLSALKRQRKSLQSILPAS